MYYVKGCQDNTYQDAVPPEVRATYQEPASQPIYIISPLVDFFLLVQSTLETFVFAF